MARIQLKRTPEQLELVRAMAAADQNVANDAKIAFASFVSDVIKKTFTQAVTIANLAQKSADWTSFGRGLSICRGAVVLNDGSLAVRDIMGQGCIFSIRLPELKPNDVRAGSLSTA